MSAIGPKLLNRTSMEIPNECIFRFVCIEGVACGPCAEVRSRCGGSAMGLAQDFSVRSVPTRAPLYARPRSEMPGEVSALRRMLEHPGTSHTAHIFQQTGVPTMLAVSRRKIAAIAVACGLLAMFPAVTQAQPPADDKGLTTALRAGGLVILVRHGATFADQADTDPFNFDNISAQRNLNDGGKALARAFGEALRQAGVPVGKVYTSKFNRAYETATIAGFTDIEKTSDLTEGGLVVSPNENNRRADALRKLLGTTPKPGTNTVLITHKPNILDALGKDWFDVKEGEASIFRPENGKYVLVARLQMADWPRLAAAAKQ